MKKPKPIEFSIQELAVLSLALKKSAAAVDRSDSRTIVVHASISMKIIYSLEEIINDAKD